MCECAPTGSTRKSSGGVLGDPFNDYLKTLHPAELQRLHLDYTEGIDAWRERGCAPHRPARGSGCAGTAAAPQSRQERGLELGHRGRQFGGEEAGRAAPHLLCARPNRRRGLPAGLSLCWPRAERVPTPGSSLESQDVCKKVTEVIACGAVRVLGTAEEVRARGALPLHLNPLTVETSKIRLCVNQRKLDLVSKWPKVELDGRQSIEGEVRGRAVHGAVADEASGYQHRRLSENSQDLFGVVFLGHVLVCTMLTFGRGPSCYYHQGHGTIPVGYHRSLGGLVELHVGESQLGRWCWLLIL